MNILLIGTGIPNKDMRGIGGAGAVVIRIAEGLARTNKVYVLPWQSERPTFFDKNLIINNVEYIGRRISLNLLYLITKFFLSGSFKVTARYAHGVNKLKYCLLYIFGRAHIELILKSFKIDVIHIHGLTLHYLPYIDAAIDKKIPLVCTSHGLYSLNPDISTDFDKNFEGDILGRISDIECAMLTVVSTKVKELCIDNFHVLPHKIKVVLNGVDYEKFRSIKKSKSELREEYSVPQDKIVLLQVGTISKRKNHIAVLKAIANMDKKTKEKLLYLVVGDGNERMNLENFVNENELNGCVMFAGRVPDEKLVDMYHLSDFFILPSTSEGLPLVFLEAMAAGLPIITFKDLEGVTDIYQSECMELIPDRDTGSVITSIKNAMKNSWNRDKIRESIAMWDWEKVCERYRELYEGLRNKNWKNDEMSM